MSLANLSNSLKSIELDTRNRCLADLKDLSITHFSIESDDLIFEVLESKCEEFIKLLNKLGYKVIPEGKGRLNFDNTIYEWRNIGLFKYKNELFPNGILADRDRKRLFLYIQTDIPVSMGDFYYLGA